VRLQVKALDLHKRGIQGVREYPCGIVGRRRVAEGKRPNIQGAIRRGPAGTVTKILDGHGGTGNGTDRIVQTHLVVVDGGCEPREEVGRQHHAGGERAGNFRLEIWITAGDDLRIVLGRGVNVEISRSRGRGRRLEQVIQIRRANIDGPGAAETQQIVDPVVETDL